MLHITYQINAVNEMTRCFTNVFGKPDVAGRRLVLSAPTGAGKTFMIASTLTKVAQDVAVLWLSPGTGRLVDQSMDAVGGYVADVPGMRAERLDPTFLAANTTIQPGVVLFVNWEQVVKGAKNGVFGNVATRDGEQANLFDLVRATHAAGTPIVLVIDESHYAMQAKGAKAFLDELRKIANPIELEASATPTSLASDQGRRESREFDVIVPVDEVIAAGMRTVAIKVNAGVQALVDVHVASGQLTDRVQLVMRAGEEQRQRLVARHELFKTGWRPLLLVQLADGKGSVERLAEVERFYAGQGITRENGRLAVWLSEDKTPDLESIASRDSGVDVLIFKQAVAKGWDCPRAKILVTFRDMVSEVFTTQVLGRTQRTIGARHFGDDELDSSYLFVDIESALVAKAAAESGVASAVGPIQDVTLRHADSNCGSLLGSYVSRGGRYNDIKKDGYQLALDAALHKTGFTLGASPSVASASIVSDLTIQFDAFEKIEGDGKADYGLTDEAAEQEFDRMIAGHVGGFVKERSVSAIRTCVLSTLKVAVSGVWDVEDDDELTVAVKRTCVALRDPFGELLAVALDNYSADPPTETKTEEFGWTPPGTLNVSSETYELLPVSDGYLYRDASGQALRPKPSGPEKDVEVWLAAEAAAGRVRAWMKNGEGDRRFFSVIYTHNGELRTTYPDYIVWLPAVDGVERVAVLEVKGERDCAPETAAKAEALRSWAADNSTAGRKLLAGVAVPQHGLVWFNDGADYQHPASLPLGSAESTWVKLAW